MQKGRYTLLSRFVWLPSEIADHIQSLENLGLTITTHAQTDLTPNRTAGIAVIATYAIELHNLEAIHAQIAKSWTILEMAPT